MTVLRGMIATAGGTALYAVVGNGFYSINSAGDRTSLGSLVSSIGYVDMKIGEQQLVIVDGPFGYTYNLTTLAFAQISDADFVGSARVAYVDGYYLFTEPQTQNFYISALEDASTLDALDATPVQGGPDRLVAVVGDHREAWLFGETTIEVWVNTGNADFPFERNDSAFIQNGLMAAFSAQSLDNTLFWLGRDERGGGQVFKSEGYRAVRVSTDAVEQQIQLFIRNGGDISRAIAYTYQQNGHAFYVLKIPGMTTCWAFDVATGFWHERADFVNGDYVLHRASMHAYCYGKNLVGSYEDGIIYEYDPDAFTNAGDTLVRDRISPHYAKKTMARTFFGNFELDCPVGGGDGDVMLRISNDGGENFGNWRASPISTGETTGKVRWTRNGSAFDRVWHVRCADDMPFAIIDAAIEAQ
jgi:hypothetical protein